MVFIGGLSIILIACPYGDAWYRANGRVVDSAGRPVHNALFWIGSVDTASADRATRVRTDSVGQFEYFEGTTPTEGQRLVRVEREGYQPFRWELPQTRAMRLTCIEIVLEPLVSRRKSRLLRADTTPSPGQCLHRSP